jgi:hypothetical protein
MNQPAVQSKRQAGAGWQERLARNVKKIFFIKKGLEKSTV